MRIIEIMMHADTAANKVNVKDQSTRRRYES